jgi:hypothetical protein
MLDPEKSGVTTGCIATRHIHKMAGHDNTALVPPEFK